MTATTNTHWYWKRDPSGLELWDVTTGDPRDQPGYLSDQSPHDLRALEAEQAAQDREIALERELVARDVAAYDPRGLAGVRDDLCDMLRNLANPRSERMKAAASRAQYRKLIEAGIPAPYLRARDVAQRIRYGWLDVAQAHRYPPAVQRFLREAAAWLSAQSAPVIHFYVSSAQRREVAIIPASEAVQPVRTLTGLRFAVPGVADTFQSVDAARELGRFLSEG